MWLSATRRLLKILRLSLLIDFYFSIAKLVRGSIAANPPKFCVAKFRREPAIKKPAPPMARARTRRASKQPSLRARGGFVSLEFTGIVQDARDSEK